MKKSVLFITALLAINSLIANPVDVNEAQTLGKKFVNSNFEMRHRGLDLSLAYTANTERGEACFYVFNVGSQGFIILSADDFYRPVIGYSENGAFDYDNIPPALREYLEDIAASRSVNRMMRKSAAPDVAADWRMLEKTGQLVSRHGGRGVDYIVQTQWNQSYPYNYYCPEDPDGDHGHAIVGCLATSMAQLVSFWKYPVHGNGSHCYYHEDYGQICADYENTYYDWDHIANTVTASSPIEEIEAAALISFHCGVSIDMGYGPDGSGGASAPIPNAMHTYFSYSDAIVQLRRDDYDTDIWKSMVREQFDMGWPMYYGGCDNGGCHAFICDGYDDHDMFHFNLGWGGSSDGWYLIDDAPYTNPADAMFNFVPQVVYDATPSAPTNLVVTPHSDTSFEATLSWTNPATYLDGTPLTDIEKIVIMRNCMVVNEITEGVTAGQTMTVTDQVPYYDSYEYKVFVVSNGRNGKQVMQQHVKFGPTCDWRIAMTSSNNQGWKDNFISVYNMADTEIAHMTMTSATPQAVHFDAPIGRLKFCWTATDTIDDMSIKVYNSQNVKVFEFMGSSVDMAAGVFYEANNGCGDTGVCDAPSGLTGVADDEDIILEWNGALNDAYAFCIYRDDHIYQMVTDNSQPYVDQNTGGLGHCYHVSILCTSGESDLSNMVCASVGDACNPARNIWYDLQDDMKPVITWDSPANSDGLTGYYVYRKCNDGDYHRVKLLSASKHEYKETGLLEEGNWYSYKVIAYYRDIDCSSIPAKARYGNEYFVKVFYSLDGVDEAALSNIAIYPNPAKDVLTIKAENLANVMIYNSLGQKIFAKTLDGNEANIDMSSFDAGIYMVRISADGNEVVKKISVVK